MQLDAQQDFSYLATPVRNDTAVAVANNTQKARAVQQASAPDADLRCWLCVERFPRGARPHAQVLLRELAPNLRMPAYLAGVLAWGTPPRAGDLQPPTSASPAAQVRCTSAPERIGDSAPLPRSSWQQARHLPRRALEARRRRPALASRAPRPTARSRRRARSRTSAPDHA